MKLTTMVKLLLKVIVWKELVVYEDVIGNLDHRNFWVASSMLNNKNQKFFDFED